MCVCGGGMHVNIYAEMEHTRCLRVSSRLDEDGDGGVGRRGVVGGHAFWRVEGFEGGGTWAYCGASGVLAISASICENSGSSTTESSAA